MPVIAQEDPVSPLVLLGPTTVGKSVLATEIADITGGTIINADRHYMYAGPNFSTGLGLEPGEWEDGRDRRLFGCLQPVEDPLAVDEYLRLVDKTVGAIHQAGKVAIIEGCTRRYNIALLNHYGLGNAIGVTWDSTHGLEEKVEERVGKLVRLGLYDETEQAIQNGYGDTFPMTSIMYKLAARALAGVLPRESAEAEMCRQGAKIHQAAYSTIAGLRWIVHDRNKTAMIAKSTLDLIAA